MGSFDQILESLGIAVSPRGGPQPAKKKKDDGHRPQDAAAGVPVYAGLSLGPGGVVSGGGVTPMSPENLRAARNSARYETFDGLAGSQIGESTRLASDWARPSVGAVSDLIASVLSNESKNSGDGSTGGLSFDPTALQDGLRELTGNDVSKVRNLNTSTIARIVRTAKSPADLAASLGLSEAAIAPLIETAGQGRVADAAIRQQQTLGQAQIDAAYGPDGAAPQGQAPVDPFSRGRVVDVTPEMLQQLLVDMDLAKMDQASADAAATADVLRANAQQEIANIERINAIFRAGAAKAGDSSPVGPGESTDQGLYKAGGFSTYTPTPADLTDLGVDTSSTETAILEAARAIEQKRAAYLEEQKISGIQDRIAAMAEDKQKVAAEAQKGERDVAKAQEREKETTNKVVYGTAVAKTALKGLSAAYPDINFKSDFDALTRLFSSGLSRSQVLSEIATDNGLAWKSLTDTADKNRYRDLVLAAEITTTGQIPKQRSVAYDEWLIGQSGE